jgi:putative phosphoesterase
MIKAGILSDTHLTRISSDFLTAVRRCFADCEVIIHAGDIVDVFTLDVFRSKTVHAVHGNCCNLSTQSALPEQLVFELGNFKIGLTHGNQFGRHGMDIEPGLIKHFPEADCLIYGHTHNAVCHYTSGKLIINPGSFQLNGRYGQPCTYAILEAGQELNGKIYEFPFR